MGKTFTVEATAYGPPWDAMEGTGITSKGVKLKAGQQKLVVAVDPTVIPYGTKLRIPNNPFGNPNLIFTAADTGGAFRGGVNKIDFFVASGRKDQNRWGRRSITVEIVGHGSPTDVAILRDVNTAIKQVKSYGVVPKKVNEEFDSDAMVTEALAKHGGDPVKAANSVLGAMAYAPTLKESDPASSSKKTSSPSTKDVGGVTPSTVPHAGSGTVLFEGKRVAAWIAPALKYGRAHGWKGTVTSGYRSFADQTRIYNSGVRPAAKPGQSNHEGTQFPRGAIDVSDAQTLSRILLRSPYAKQLVFAGAKDPVHFSHPHGGSY